MSIFEDLEEIKRLADYIGERVQPIVDKYSDDMPRSEIATQIRWWVANGNIVLRVNQGTRTEVAAKVKDGKLYPTSYPALMATDIETRDKFEHYITCGRLLDYNKVSVRKGYYTQYAVDKAVRTGELQRIDTFGSAITLYID